MGKTLTLSCFSTKDFYEVSAIKLLFLGILLASLELLSWEIAASAPLPTTKKQTKKKHKQKHMILTISGSRTEVPLFLLISGEVSGYSKEVTIINT